MNAKATRRTTRTFERTDRRNGKWAKLVRHTDGKYTLARGRNGKFNAEDVLNFTRRDHAEVYLDSWLDD